MANPNQGSLRLFRFAGVDVFLHWSWFFVAIFEINGRSRAYSSLVWNVLEYLALFVIVLMHEYGHALACRQTGGTANRIMLWPLGGVAFVNPPQRAGANLWSIAAGPLVNVVLVPVFLVLAMMCRSLGIPQTMPNAYALLRAVAFMNAGLLVFNLLPIYPLDGGQIVRSLLWFIFGRARSLTIAASLGFLGVAALILAAIKLQSGWFAVISLFMLVNCWGGLQHARALGKIGKLSRREGFACPACKMAPPVGSLWKCSGCTSSFDSFASHAECPTCGTKFETTTCIDCRASNPVESWRQAEITIAASVSAPS